MPRDSYTIGFDIRPPDDEVFRVAVHDLVDGITPGEVSPERLGDLERQLRQRWPDARLTHAWARPAAAGGHVVWTASRDAELADPERVGMFAPPPARAR